MKIVRQKVEGQFTTLYDPSNGHLLQYVSDDYVGEPTKFPSPNLTDLKITDACDLGCKFCYQGSTSAGKGPRPDLVSRLPQALADLGVFEVAIGGGEPTQWDGLLDIMKAFRAAKVTPNFTTKNYKLILAGGLEPFARVAGAFAVSIQSPTTLRKLLPHLKPLQAFCKVHLQVVVGVVGTEELRKIAQCYQEADLDCLTLLGFKEVGFGATYSNRKECDWIAAIEGVDGVAVDSALAAQNLELMAQFPPTSWGHTEGGSNLYVDAVSGTCAPSSYYEGTEGLFDLPTTGDLSEQLRQIWPLIPVV